MSDNKPQSFDEIIEELRHRQPFLPFNVVMTSGDRYLIDDPFMMINTPVEIMYAVPRSEKVARLHIKPDCLQLEELHPKHAA